jgi:hypothetical protein
MGKRNRQRRAEKQRRKRAQARSRPRGDRPPFHQAFHPESDDRPAPATADLLRAAGAARLGGDDAAAEVLVERLCDVATGPDRDALVAEVDRLLAVTVSQAWSRGWQPVDVERVARHRLGKDEAALVVDAIAADPSVVADGAVADERWRAQLDDIGAPIPRGEQPPFASLGAPTIMSWVDALWRAAGVIGLVARLPYIPVLMPPPGRGHGDGQAMPAGTDGIDERILERVRALLAKAESTQYEAEAEALSAKAQELIARHSVDRAVLDSARPRGPEPIARRIGIEPPYVDAKGLLLSEVASANRCRAVQSPDLYFSTVFGYEPDVEATDLLYTSLLVQAGVAMRAAGSVRDRAGRSRTRSFRQSFLVGFAIRIGERLREAAESATVQAEAEHGTSLLPVLAGRSAHVDDACRSAYPDLAHTTMRAGNGLGYYAGRVAADQASITVHAEVDERAATA